MSTEYLHLQLTSQLYFVLLGTTQGRITSQLLSTLGGCNGISSALNSHFRFYPHHCKQLEASSSQALLQVNRLFKHSYSLHQLHPVIMRSVVVSSCLFTLLQVPALAMPLVPRGSELYHRILRDIGVDSTSNANLTERQYPVPIDTSQYCKYGLIGDGNPHTDYYHYQLTKVQGCGGGDNPDADSCSSTHTESISHTFGWSVGIGGSTDPGFFSGGFDVSESITVTTGESDGCNAGAGESVCVWANVPQ